MADTDFVERCKRLILEEVWAASQGEEVELWEAKTWFCLCWRACISAGLAAEFKSSMEPHMGEDRMLRFMDGHFNGGPFLRTQSRLLEVLRSRDRVDRIRAFENLIDMVRLDEREYAQLLRGGSIHKAGAASLWNAKPSLRQVLTALAADQLFDFTQLDLENRDSAPPLLKKGGRPTAALAAFMCGIRKSRPDIDGFAKLRDLVKHEGSLGVVDPIYGYIEASVVYSKRDFELKFELRIKSHARKSGSFKLKVAENAFRRAKNVA